MKKKLLLLSFLIILNFKSFAQTVLPGCDAEFVDSIYIFNQPHFGNNQYLIDLVNNVEGSPATRIAPQMIRIPVTIWIHGSSTFSNISNDVAEQYIQYINTFYENNGVKIRFYVRCNGINRITNSPYTLANQNNNDSMFDTYWTGNTMNIHFTLEADGVARGRFPWKNKPYAAYIPTYYSSTLNIDYAKILTHEVGHAMGLLHTHNSRSNARQYNGDCGNCYQESVDKSREQGYLCTSTIGKKKCEVNGDLLCDTDADPILYKDNVSYTPGCVYDRNISPYKQDNWGDAWLRTGNANAIANIMSYSRPLSCETQLTQMQRGVEYFYALNKYSLPFKEQPVTFYQNDEVDNYENDNSYSTGRVFSVGNVEQRSFHGSPDAAGQKTFCDVDWVRFTASSNYLYIGTIAIAGKSDADTKITLFDSYLNPIASHDDNSSTDKYSFLSITTLNYGQRYFVKIENKNATLGYYQLFMGCTSADFNKISGNSQICTTGQYSVSNLPSNSTITWSSSNTNGLTINQNGLATRVNNFNGQANVTATINTDCGSSTTIALNNIQVGGGRLPTVYVDYKTNCNYLQANPSNLAPGTTGLIWYLTDLDTKITRTFNTMDLTTRRVVSNPVNNTSYSFLLEVAVINDCGTSGKYSVSSINIGPFTGGKSCSELNVISPPDDSEDPIVIYPNPADDQFTVTMVDSGSSNTTSLSTQSTSRETNQNATIETADFKVDVYNQFNQLLKSEKSINGKVQLNTSDLLNGFYYLQIQEKGRLTRKQVLVQH